MNSELDLAQFESFQPTYNEYKIMMEMRKLGPYGFIQITADGQGKPDSYLVHKSTKILFIQGQPPKNIRTGS